MKKIIFTFLIAVITLNSLFADDFKIRLVENDMGYMEVQMKCVTASVTPTTSTPISGFTFQIRWLTSLGADIDLLCASNPYNIEDGLGSVQTEGSYSYRTYHAYGTPFNCPTNWVTNEWETITSFVVNMGSGSGDFDIPPDGWVNYGLNWQIDDPVVYYNPDAVSGITGYPFPTIVYNYVWVGGGQSGFESDWFFGGNWSNECGATPSSGPTATNNVYIPDVSSASGYFPNQNLSGTMACMNMRIANGAHLTVPSTNGNLAIGGKLFPFGALNIVPDADVTVTGDTYIGGAQSIVVQADATGVGSFIDNGTISYGTSGTAKVQTYLENTAAAGFFQIHLIGPTVDMANYTGTGTGALLSAFNIAPDHTYAYRWVEPSDAWANIHSLSYEIPTTKGFALSTDDATNYTLEMSGALITGSLSSEAMSNDVTGNFLLSNPYPSSIFWDDMYGDNTGSVNDAVYVWDAGFTGGNYRAYNQGSGGTDNFSGYIQVGQGFFVESTGTATFSFNNTQRHHSVDPFYAPRSYSNRLDVRIAGANYSDGLLIHFYDGALSGYEANEDILKMDSRYDVAPEIWTDLDDSSRLSINALPLSLLTRGLLSIPMSFKAGENGDYTLSFLDINTFEAGTEVYLEDKQTGGDWVYLNDNPEYTFSGKPEDLKDRFVIHFFGVTGINEQVDLSSVYIYSYGRNAYVVNKNKLDIKKVLIYSMSGVMVQEREELPDVVNKIWVSNSAGYYVVRVVTPQKVFTGKVFISNF